eukprot:12935809-Prorocentrum_lima.AAC.1
MAETKASSSQHSVHFFHSSLSHPPVFLSQGSPAEMFNTGNSFNCSQECSSPSLLPGVPAATFA